VPRLRSLGFGALASAFGLGALVVAAWAVDGGTHGGRVARNTALAGVAVGGLTPAQLAAEVGSIADEYRQQPVVVDAPGGGFTTNAADLGLSVDTAATQRAVLDVGRKGSVTARVTGWTRGLLTDREASVRVHVDADAVHRVVATKDPGPRTAPVEPQLKARSGGTGFTVADGKAGKGIDPSDVIAALPRAAASTGPVHIKVGRGSITPRYSKADAQALEKDAERATAKPLAVKAGSASATVPTATLRTWVRSEVGDSGLRLGVDPKKSATDLAKLLQAAATPATQLRFTVGADGTPAAQPGTPGSACCGQDATRLVAAAIFADQPATDPIELPLKLVPPAVTADQIAALGVKELVSSFTTRYPAGQPRVTNIHRIADIVKGTLIKPGETFSLNGRVGPRTLAKGFVVDHQINDEGAFDEAVGGGVSQFATTTFNAAFFAGLDYGEYQSHTIYISRYPYGREATVSWQHPDLQIRNTTPYGIVIWASYTGSSVTVSLYSTKYLQSVTQSAQSSAPYGPGCTRVTTERTRVYLDGHSKVDHVFATYQPAEGKPCR
jgi:vancomycin resistance protein YoaR